MKRKLSKEDEKETRLSELLFSKSKKLAEKLDSESTSELDVDLKPAWIDDDDENFATYLSDANKNIYTEKLKQKYETLMGTPSWAKVNKSKEAGLEDDEVLRKVGHLHKKKSNQLPKGCLELQRLPNANEITNNEGPIVSCFKFHPKISAALVGGQSGIVSLFSIGGDTNNKLHSFKLKGWKITAAHFTPDGSQALIASKLRRQFCVYNLETAKHTLVDLPEVVTKAVIFETSSNGKYIATSDGLDEVYLLCLASKELIKVFSHNTNIVSVIFNHDSSQLFCYGAEGEITIWDLATHRAVTKFYDHGCVTASCLAASNCGKLLASGSGEGIVNIYKTEDLTTTNPMPHKVISNLTTKISNIEFNPTTEILAASSQYYPNAVKLVHIPSYHVYFNFPMQKFNLHYVNSVSFSPNSGYMGLGNNKGGALLYRLKYYKNY